MLRIAVLDDYQQVARQMADWSRLADRAEVAFFHDHARGDDLVARLRDAGPDDLVDANVLISNIRGPAQPWHLFGREVVDLYIDGPPSNGVGLNVMLWSYGDRLLLGILAFADALQDPAALTRHVEAAFADLHKDDGEDPPAQ